MEKATLRNIKDIKGKRVFIRVDHNVPQDEKGGITDDTRIRESLDTIRYCIDKGAHIILCSHLGRPKSKADVQYTMAPIVEWLRTYLTDTKIYFADDCIGKKVEDMVAKLKDGEIVYLENIRFYPEETANVESFAKSLANLCDYYVNDAFGAAHRAHASTEGIAKFVHAVAGFLMEREVKILSEAITKPKRPLAIILGGKKIADKIGVIDNLIKVADDILIGGGMAYTFVKAQGGEIGKSIVDDTMIDYCKNVYKTAKERKVNLIVGMDCIAGDSFSPDANTRVFETNKVRDGWEGMDIGPKTVEAFKHVIGKAGTVIWCGPLGVTEFDKFSNGSREIGNAMAASKAITIAGGGDTAFTVAKFGLSDKFTHISTGGGASLELLEGKALPGVVVLLDNDVVIE